MEGDKKLKEEEEEADTQKLLEILEEYKRRYGDL